MTNKEALQKEYKALDIEAGKCNHKEFDKVYKIIAELTKGRNDVGDNGNFALPLVTGSIIDEALKKAGYAGNRKIVQDFKKYREIEQKARDIQFQLIKLDFKELPKPKIIPNKWNFYPIAIYVSQQFMPTMDKVLNDDLKNNRGVFSNVTEFKEEDEFEDKFLMIKAFNMECSLAPFLDELKAYNVVGVNGLLHNKFKYLLFSLLKFEATFIKDNPTRPARIKNHINKTLKKLDLFPGWSIIFQILTIQGLCKWLQSIKFAEGDSAINDIQSLYNWLFIKLVEKEMRFCYMPFGNNDKERLGPLCDYLYSTDAGQIVQARLFKSTNTFPIELMSKQAKEYLQAGINAGLMGADYQWLKTKGLAAYFASKMSDALSMSNAQSGSKKYISWKPFELLWNYPKDSMRKNWQDYQKTGEPPCGYDIVDKIFK